MSLPGGLQDAVAAWLARRPAAGSRRAGSAALTATYRQGGTSTGIDLGAYLVARLPATYAAVSRVLSELALLLPEFAPDSILDAGSGPGTASWAAVDQWPALRQVTFLDPAPDFLDLARGLARMGPPALAQARAVQGAMERLPDGLSADLVVAAYAMAELPLERAGEVAQALWAASRAALVLVEPGTPQGFSRLAAARQRLLGLGAIILAPCTHALACPMHGGDWCHFSVRLARSRAHMHAKSARVPFEDERFSYLAVARHGSLPEATARIIAPPQQAKHGITLRLCTAGRIETAHVARRDGAAYKIARKLGWGDRTGPAHHQEEAS